MMTDDLHVVRWKNDDGSLDEEVTLTTPELEHLRQSLRIEDSYGPIPDPHPGLLILGDRVMRDRPDSDRGFLAFGLNCFWVRRPDEPQRHPTDPQRMSGEI